MKQKLFSIMLLVFGAILGVQAENQTLVDYPSSMEGITISGTTASGTVKIHNNTDETACLSLKNGYTSDGAYNNNSINLAIEGGFKKGDVITLAGATNVKQTDVDADTEGKKRAAAVIFTMDETGKITKLHQTPDFINGNITNLEPVEDSYTLEVDAEKLYIGRDGGTQAHLVLVKVVRPAAGGEDVGTPVITFEAGAVERTITIGLNAAGTVKVDWGDGTLSEQTAAGAYDGWDNGLEFTGIPSGIVKIYGEGVNYFQAFTKYTDDAIVGGITSVDLSNATAITELDLHQNSLSSVDLSKLTALTSLMIGVNEFESIDLSANTELTMLDISDGKNTGKLASIDLSNNTKLTKVVLSGNKLSVLDLSKNPLVKTLTVLNNELASVTFGENTASKHTINLGGNKLTSVDLSGFTTYSGTYLRVRDNELKEIVLPGKIGQIWADGNAFTLSQLYALKSQANTLTYASTYTKPEAQQPMVITADGNKVDLSSEAMLGESATVFVWKTSDGTVLVEGTDYTAENGVFTFLTAQKDIYCEMTNAEFPLFTAEKPFKTTLVSVDSAGCEDVGTPAITFEAGAVERTITIGLNAAGTVKVDWGDGTLSEQTAAGAYDGWDNGLEFTGIPSGIVKIYGEGVNYFQAFTKYTDDAIVGGITSVDLSNATAITELDLHQNSLSSVDLSKLTALTSLMIGVNEFESIDLSANTELTMLDISDGKNTGKLASIDLSNNTKLTKVVLSGNKLSVLDLSKNPLVKTLTVLNNELASVTFGENTASKHTINLGGNKLTSVDLSGFTTYSGTYLRVRDNELKEIVLPGKIGQIWADGNAFTLSQLYALKSQANTLTYASTYTKPEAQQPMVITADGNKVDLSSEAMLGESATVFVWKTSDGTVLVEGTDYTAENGVFTFLTAQKDIYCEMTNAELSAFTTEKPFKTTSVTIEEVAGIRSLEVSDSNNTPIYNLKGQRVSGHTKGIIIKNGKKVFVK